MNTLLPVTAGEIENYYCVIKMNVSCFQEIIILLTLQSSVTLMAVVRKRRLTYYNSIILFLCSFYIFLKKKSLNQNTRLPSYGCHQCFAPISFVVAMLDDISSLPSRSVPT